MVSRTRSSVAAALVFLCLSVGFAPEAQAAPRDSDSIRDRIVRVIQQIRNLLPSTNDNGITPPKP